ncbi:hypothetical protein BDV93DRAFT_549100 [Ceratobasidium sp. AG-I]|nr:hypothetical protein BDV93DRAFT_549100 [Ceratobasidium sp. AG-I]
MSPEDIDPLSTYQSSSTLQSIYDDITTRYDATTENTWVESVTFCKERKGSRHEFILIYTVDSSTNTKATLLLERTSDVPMHEAIRSVRSILSWFCGTRVAQDRLKILRDGNLWDLKNRTESINMLETLRFTCPDKPLFLYELIILSYITSVTNIEYHLFTAQCYWFAGMVWDCITRLRPEADLNTLKKNQRGRFARWFHQKIRPKDLSVISTIVQTQIELWKSHYKVLQESCVEKEESQARERNKKLEEEILRLSGVNVS